MSIRTDLTNLGVAGPLSAELEKQIQAGTGNVRRLMELGFNAAAVLAAGITAGTIKVAKLAELGVPTELAKYIGRAINVVPVNLALPGISGTVAVGQVLTASNGSWNSKSTITYTRQWQRYSNQEAPFAWENIAGATATTYTIAAGDVAYQLRCVVTAANANGAKSATSAATIVVPA